MTSRFRDPNPIRVRFGIGPVAVALGHAREGAESVEEDSEGEEGMILLIGPPGRLSPDIKPLFAFY